MADTYGCSARILVNGRKVREYEREDGSIFVESKINSEYEIELKNHTGTKVLAIVSVDGLDVISGKTADNNSPGYILKPHSSMKVKGFRKDDDTVGSFRFVNKNKSYAKGQGAGGNEGVISVRFFDEKQKQVLFANHTVFAHLSGPPQINTWIDPNSSAGNPNQNQYWTSGVIEEDGQIRGSISCNTTEQTYGVSFTSNNVGCSGQIRGTNSNPNPFTTGTTWGTKKFDKVYKREFERGNLLGEINFYYTTKEGLESLGVPVVEEKYVSYPRGFSDYATPPKGWA